MLFQGDEAIPKPAILPLVWPDKNLQGQLGGCFVAEEHRSSIRLSQDYRNIFISEGADYFFDKSSEFEKVINVIEGMV